MVEWRRCVAGGRAAGAPQRVNMTRADIACNCTTILRLILLLHHVDITAYPDQNIRWHRIVLRNDAYPDPFVLSVRKGKTFSNFLRIIESAEPFGSHTFLNR